MKEMMIHLSFDDEAEMAYITLLPRWIKEGEIVRTRSETELTNVAHANFDFDGDGKLIGIELETHNLHPDIIEELKDL